MYKPGDIILVKMHPSSGAELRRYRPCVILFDQIDPRFYTIIPLTSQTTVNFPKTELYINQSSINNLEGPSVLLCWYIKTIGINRAQKLIGKLSRSDYQKMKSTVMHILK